MSMTPYMTDPFFGQIERAIDRAMCRFLGDRPLGELSLAVPSLGMGPGMGPTGYPMDIIETKDAFEVTADAPGFDPSDITVQMHEGTLTISGNRKDEKEEKDTEGRVVRRERHFNQFTRSFTMPENVTGEGVTAQLDQGILRVTVPKVEPSPKPEPKRITVQGSSNPAIQGST